eukprot:TRINITY_DN8284_c0_g3_i1.p1 TRINITY_DN8284_c0_g3~~TRINITY_DN8284_c0_g3_i1.p1  ORF type:complete len:352 (-),score=44.90 TRINITY_DN8284_c0_g3_i1:111-1166(-)
MCLSWQYYELQAEQALIQEYGPMWRLTNQVVNLESGEYRCDLCWGRVLCDLNTVQDHIRSKKHQNKLGYQCMLRDPLAGIPEDQRQFAVVDSDGYARCTLCGPKCPVWDIAHMQCSRHRERLQCPAYHMGTSQGAPPPYSPPDADGTPPPPPPTSPPSPRGPWEVHHVAPDQPAHAGAEAVGGHPIQFIEPAPPPPPLSPPPPPAPYACAPNISANGQDDDLEESAEPPPPPPFPPPPLPACPLVTPTCANQAEGQTHKMQLPRATPAAGPCLSDTSGARMIVTRSYDAIERGENGRFEGGYVAANAGDVFVASCRDLGHNGNRFDMYAYGYLERTLVHGWIPLDVLRQQA